MSAAWILAAALGIAGEAPLRVLLASEPGTERTEDWRRFLHERFGSADVVAIEALTGERMRGFDLVVLDRDDFVTRNVETSKRIDAKPPSVALEEWRTPTILVGAIGGTTADRLGLKIGWGAFG